MAKTTDPQRIWYCPVCGTRLSYGIYCKTCEVETSFALRPATELDRLREELRSLPVPPYPEYPDA